MRVRLAVKDVTGTVASAESPAFTIDSTPPSVISASPADGAQNLPLSPTITINFSEPMNRGTVERSFSLTAESAVAGNSSWANGDTTFIFSPSALLNYQKNYTFSVTADATDLVGNNLSPVFSSSFSVSSSPDAMVQYPAGGERLKGGATVNLLYLATSEAGLAPNPVSLCYSADSGSSWTPIVNDTAYTGSYPWTVPTIDASGARIMVAVRDVIGNLVTRGGGDFRDRQHPALCRFVQSQLRCRERSFVRAGHDRFFRADEPGRG